MSPKSAVSSSPAGASADVGSTLIEVMVASVIMASAVIVLVTGMSTLFGSSIFNRTATTAGVVARDYAEALVVAVAQSDAWCATSYPVSFTPPPGYTATAIYGACPASTATTPQFQAVTISVVPPTGLTETLRIVVRET